MQTTITTVDLTIDNENWTVHGCFLDTATASKRYMLDTHAHILPSTNISLKFQEKEDYTYSEDGYTQLTTMTFCNKQTRY